MLRSAPALHAWMAAVGRRAYPNSDAWCSGAVTAYPIHLHGQSLEVLVIGGTRYQEPIVRGVVDIAAHTGSAVVEWER
jgi:hypothetical protein